ncbi:MAG: hypothetical protein QHH14_05585 [Clostridiales bacterium]|jgi:hypothetical protein|nr:hypothetical protein [Clostridiales bacterium]
MRCRKYEKWISDSLDKEFNTKRSRKLASHLAKCGACRAYKERLRLLQQEALRLEIPDFAPRYWEEFSRRLRPRLQAVQPGASGVRLGWRNRRWAWAGAAVLIAAAFSLVLILRRGPEAEENNIFSFERCLDRVYGEIGDDSQLADLFNVALVRALREEAGADDSVTRTLSVEDPLFLEGLSEEEMEFLNREIEKEIKS